MTSFPIKSLQSMPCPILQPTSFLEGPAKATTQVKGGGVDTASDGSKRAAPKNLQNQLNHLQQQKNNNSPKPIELHFQHSLQSLLLPIYIKLPMVLQKIMKPLIGFVQNLIKSCQLISRDAAICGGVGNARNMKRRRLLEVIMDDILPGKQVRNADL